MLLMANRAATALCCRLLRLSSSALLAKADGATMRNISVALCAAIWCFVFSPAVHAFEWRNCDGFGKPDLAPIGSGPLELTNVYCQRVRRDFAQVAMISPDGRAIVYLQGGGISCGTLPWHGLKSE